MGLQPRKALKCSKCSKKYKAKRDFTKHLLTHDPDAKVKCKICGKISKHPAALTWHMKNIHSGRKQPSCDICSRVFHNPSSLRRHTKSMHSTSERPRMPCTFPGCEKTFLRKQHVSRHIKTDHAENPVRIRCALCEKGFKSRAELEQHIPVHTTEKPFKCSTCGKRFAHISQKNRHETIHLERSKRAIFKCPHCPSTSFRKLDLQKHIRTVHENRRHYPCSNCTKKFTSVARLERHVEARHPENQDPFYSCDKCDYKSHSKYNLTRHVRRHNTAKWRECYFCGKKYFEFRYLVQHFGLHTMEK